MPAVILTASFCAAWLLVGAIRWMALRAGVLDIPNARSSHVAPTPRGGGGAIAILTLAAVLAEVTYGGLPAWVGIGVVVGGVLIAAAGLIDDIRGLSVAARLVLQCLAAVTLLVITPGLPKLPLPHGSLDLHALGWVLGGMVIIWSINLYNFMDGIDGLAASQVIFVSAAAISISRLGGVTWTDLVPLLTVLGASLGFLLWNLPPAKIFMGDVGSGFLGFVVVANAFLLASQGTTNLWTWLILNATFFADASATLVMRLLRGERAYQAHRSHVYQRLAKRMGSHLAVTLYYSAVNVVWCLPWAIASAYHPAEGIAFACLAVLPLCVIALLMGAGTAPDRGESISKLKGHEM